MRVGGYHEYREPWREPRLLEGELYGLELELRHPTNRQVLADALDGFPRGRSPAPIAERDGSLDELRGVEIICPPLPLAQVTTEQGYIGRLMRTMKEAGAEEEVPATYGLHINVNLHGWGREERLLTQYLLNLFDEEGTKVGRRPGHARGGAYRPVFTVVPDGHTNLLKLNTFNGDKHCAAFIRRTGGGLQGDADGGVMEVRLCKSTLNVQDVKDTIDYVQSIRAFVRAAPRDTIKCIFWARALEDTQTKELLRQLYLEFTKRRSPDVLRILGVDADMVPLNRGSRTDKARQVVEQLLDAHYGDRERGNIRKIVAGVSFNGPYARVKEQIFRVGTLLGGRARLQGEFNTTAGRVTCPAASIRAVD